MTTTTKTIKTVTLQINDYEAFPPGQLYRIEDGRLIPARYTVSGAVTNDKRFLLAQTPCHLSDPAREKAEARLKALADKIGVPYMLVDGGATVQLVR